MQFSINWIAIQKHCKAEPSICRLSASSGGPDSEGAELKCSPFRRTHAQTLQRTHHTYTSISSMLHSDRIHFDLYALDVVNINSARQNESQPIYHAHIHRRMIPHIAGWVYRSWIWSKVLESLPLDRSHKIKIYVGGVCCCSRRSLDIALVWFGAYTRAGEKCGG